MRTFEEVQADINILKTEIEEIASVKLAAIAFNHAVDLLHRGMHSIEMVFGDNPCSPSYRRLLIKNAWDRISVTVTAGGAEVQFVYDLNGSFLNDQPRFGNALHTTMNVLDAWSRIAEAEASEREKRRFEIDRDAQREP